MRHHTLITEASKVSVNQLIPNSPSWPTSPVVAVLTQVLYPTSTSPLPTAMPRSIPVTEERPFPFCNFQSVTVSYTLSSLAARPPAAALMITLIPD